YQHSVFVCSLLFFFIDLATAMISTLSLHDALPILRIVDAVVPSGSERLGIVPADQDLVATNLDLVDSEGRESRLRDAIAGVRDRSEEHTSELQSRGHLVCRLLLEKKKKKTKIRLIA